MKLNSLHDLLVDGLKDLYSAENQLVKALPKMAKAANSDELRTAFEEHLEETKGHVQRLDEIFKQLEASPKGKKCAAMEGLVEEGKEIIDMDGVPAVLDAGIICAAQKVEHYEIASYGCFKTFATLLGLDDIAELLEQTLNEEKAADEKLTEIAETTINPEASDEDEEEEGEEDEGEEEDEEEEQQPAKSKKK